MLANFSPQKENRSPSPTRKIYLQKNAAKSSHIISQLTNLLNSHEISIPSHLNLDQDENGVNLMKLNSSVDSKQLGRTKAKLADKQFQVKRLQQDFAEFKLLSRLENEKAMKRLRDQVNTLKVKHSEEVKKWQTNYTQMVQKYQKQREDFTEQTQKHYKDLSDRTISYIKQKYQKEINELQILLKQQRESKKLESQNMKEQYETRVIIIKQTCQKQLETLNQKHQNQIIKTQQKCQAKIVAIECQKNAQVKSAQNVVENTFKKEEKYLKQIGILQRDKNNLFQKLDDTEMKLKVISKKYDDRGKMIENSKKQHEEKLKQLQNQLSKVKNQTETTIQQQKLKVLKDNYEKTQSLQNKLKDLEERKSAITEDYNRNQRTLNAKFQRRESKKEDVQLIKQMSYKLSQKEREMMQLQNHIRYYQLEKENNDKVYTRIFSSARQKKGNSFRQDRDIYSILKQTHTTDLRHILKITKKDSKK